MQMLPAFPTDPMTLDMVEASLAFRLTVTDDGQPVPVDPDVVSLASLLDFLSGTSTDPLGVVEHLGETATAFGQLDTSFDPRPTYSEKDVIQALIDEVRALRALTEKEQD